MDASLPLWYDGHGDACMKHTVLVVEDNAEIRGIVAKYLDAEGYCCLTAKDGFEALALFARRPVHLVLLDVMMPGIDGFEVLRELRKISDVPVILLTARQDEIDRLRGFDVGADDYVVKPFSLKELMKRVGALLRRVYHDTGEAVYQYRELSLHAGMMKLCKGAAEIPVTAAEYALLEVMFRHPGQVLSREQLIGLAFGSGYEGYGRSIDSHIRRLRQKIEDDPGNPKILLTKYGAGYVFGETRI